MGHHDGVSSDDEENQSEIMKFNQERGGNLYFISQDVSQETFVVL